MTHEQWRAIFKFVSNFFHFILSFTSEAFLSLLTIRVEIDIELHRNEIEVVTQLF